MIHRLEFKRWFGMTIKSQAIPPANCLLLPLGVSLGLRGSIGWLPLLGRLLEGGLAKKILFDVELSEEFSEA